MSIGILLKTRICSSVNGIFLLIECVHLSFINISQQQRRLNPCLQVGKRYNEGGISRQLHVYNLGNSLKD